MCGGPGGLQPAVLKGWARQGPAVHVHTNMCVCLCVCKSVNARECVTMCIHSSVACVYMWAHLNMHVCNCM